MRAVATVGDGACGVTTDEWCDQGGRERAGSHLRSLKTSPRMKWGKSANRRWMPLVEAAGAGQKFECQQRRGPARRPVNHRRPSSSASRSPSAPSSLASRSPSASSSSVSRARATSIEPAPTWTRAQEPNRFRNPRKALLSSDGPCPTRRRGVSLHRCSSKS